MILSPNGGLVIDTPGMREFQMWAADDGLREAFSDLDALSSQCHFRDCSHTVEARCAVLAAVADGRLSQDRYNRFIQLRKELDYLQEAHTKHSWMERRRLARVAQRAFNQAKRKR